MNNDDAFVDNDDAFVGPSSKSAKVGMAQQGRATGVEARQADVFEGAADVDVAQRIAFDQPHLRLTQVVLRDVTDRCNELCQERHWLLHPSENGLALRGNLFAVEDVLTGRGRVFVRQAPLPGARAVPQVADLQVRRRGKSGGYTVELLHNACDRAGEGDDWVILEYGGGAAGRTRVLHGWQQALRPATREHRVPRLLTNTWGDRSRDGAIQEDFILREIAAGRRLGADVIQIDDGWQRGSSANSVCAAERGGVWEGFRNNDPRFWEVDRERFPGGLELLVQTCRDAGMTLGLWFAPDSRDNFADWEKDAALLLELHRRHGIAHFKVDSIMAGTAAAQSNLQRFFQAVREGSQGRIVLDLDITAGKRPGYFGAMDVGPLFVENRYTDWGNYWPHHTLRNLWKLAGWIDPRRLRMEFLNHTRNADKYGDDPLAPAAYAPETLFAHVMFSNPLGWFEVSNLPSESIERTAALVTIWKAHREEIFAGHVYPVGEDPALGGLTGFISLAPDCRSGYLLVFRGLQTPEKAYLTIPPISVKNPPWQTLAGLGSCCWAGRTGVAVEMPEHLGFLFARFG